MLPPLAPLFPGLLAVLPFDIRSPSSRKLLRDFKRRTPPPGIFYKRRQEIYRTNCFEAISTEVEIERNKISAIVLTQSKNSLRKLDKDAVTELNGTTSNKKQTHFPTNTLRFGEQKSLFL